MKHASAITTAIIITAVIGLGILVVGLSAFTNKNIVPLQNSPNSSTTSSAVNSSSTNSSANSSTSNSSANSASSSTSAADIQKLEQEITTLQSQLGQANQMVQQYQNLLIVLQQRGVIRIDQNGNIYLPQG